MLFGSQIEKNSGGIRRPSKSNLETTVVLHEMGHLLGLVNVGSEMVEPHEDESYDHHCDNEDCLMYWAIETNSFLIICKMPSLHLTAIVSKISGQMVVNKRFVKA